MTGERQALLVRSRAPALAAAILTTIILVFVGWELISEFKSNRVVRAEMDRSYETRSQIQRVFSLLQDAETGQRGYVITGNDQFLEPYDRATSALDEQMRILSGLLRDRPAQLADLAQLQVLTVRKRTFMEEGIDARQVGGIDAGMTVVSAAQGKQVMDDMRTVVARMTEVEARALDAYSDTVAFRTSRTEAIVSALFIALLATVAAAAFLIWRYTRARQTMLNDLSATATRQAAIFDGAIDAIITLNPSGSVETVNAAGERMFGYPASELDRRDISLLLDMAPDGRWRPRVRTARPSRPTWLWAPWSFRPGPTSSPSCATSPSAAVSNS
jgi:CHASE3 domain sensor protein